MSIGQANSALHGGSPDPTAVRAELSRILVSRPFRQSGQLKCFLHHCVEAALNGEYHRLKEYAIGVEVLHRGTDFDPRIDPIVRVQARKLRARLEEFYAGEGRDARIVIRFDKGAYVPTFGPAAPAQNQPPEPGSAAQDAPPAPTPLRAHSAAHFEDPAAAGPETPAALSRHWRTAFWIAAAIVLIQAAAFWTVSMRLSAPRPGTDSLAFCRFSLVDGDPAAAAIAGALSAAAEAALTYGGRVRLVKPKTDSAAPPERLSTALGVDAVLGGYAERHGSRVRVKAELYRASEGYRIWSGTYEDAADPDGGLWRRVAAHIASRVPNVIQDARHKHVGLTPVESLSPAAPSATYDPVRDFLSDLNPSPGGVWAYGWKPAPNAPFALYPRREEVTFGGARTIGWSRSGGLPGSSSCPYVARNLSGKTASFSPVSSLPPDALLLHPGANGEVDVVRWTAPRTAAYSVYARFDAHNFTTTGVTIRCRATALAAGVIEGAGVSHDFALRRIWIEAGDHVDFEVDYGENHSFSADSTGLKALIVEEPRE